MSALPKEAGIDAAAPVDLPTAHRITQFLYREARLLDAERWQDWLALMSEDIHLRTARAREAGCLCAGRGAYFDDNLLDLSRRVALPAAVGWAEDPPTRHVHVISNVEALHGAAAGEYTVHSVFVNYRSRGEADNDLLLGRREDLRVHGEPEAGEFRIARRKIVITQSLFLSKNLNTFL